MLDEVPASDLTTRPRGPDERTRIEPQSLSDEEVLARLRASDQIEHFTIVRRLGEGGMGIVSLAYDERLDRKVALKVIRQGFCDQPDHRRRLLREARALARLSHPNVVAIYEVGEYCGRPYLAMEYVEGAELREWLRQAKRPLHEVLRVFVDAGRGLAAAHAAGLVHRDFKPANVLVSTAGRACVLDFGLSRAADVAAPAGEGHPPTDAVTVAGVIIGTPAYMSPEQLLGRPLDARSDQYAFAVALYEALVGTRPFGGKGLKDRLREGFTVTIPADAGLPRGIQRALQRALAESPDQRFGSMDALLAALTADRWRRWRMFAGAAALAGVAAGVGVGLTGGEACTGGAAQIAGVWSAEAREAVRAALLPAAADASGAARLTDVLGAYASDWAAAHRDACLANVRGESSAEALDVRMRCLGQARLEYAALVEDLHDATKKVNAGTRDMLISAVSDMTRRSNAVRLVAYGADSANVIGFLREAERKSAYQNVPDYGIRGSISQLEENLARRTDNVGVQLGPVGGGSRVCDRGLSRWPGQPPCAGRRGAGRNEVRPPSDRGRLRDLRGKRGAPA